MHKGYTLNYFIKFFQNVPAKTFKNTNALAIADGAGSSRSSIGRGDALQSFLANSTVDISNGNLASYRKLGATPRTRILKALRNRKSTGNVLGVKLK